MCQSPDSTTELRRFCAYCSTTEGYAAPLRLTARSAGEAAFDFADHWHGAGEVGVLVIDEETGEQACFTLDLGH